jgi:hypothetical protein
MLITTEEYAALMGVEPVLADKDTSDPPDALSHYKYMRMLTAESAPTRSLRDVISNEEIAALLSDFPVDFKKSKHRQLKIGNKHKHSRVRPAQRRQVYAK